MLTSESDFTLRKSLIEELFKLPQFYDTLRIREKKNREGLEGGIYYVIDSEGLYWERHTFGDEHYACVKIEDIEYNPKSRSYDFEKLKQGMSKEDFHFELIKNPPLISMYLHNHPPTFCVPAPTLIDLVLKYNSIQRNPKYINGLLCTDSDNCYLQLLQLKKGMEKILKLETEIKFGNYLDKSHHPRGDISWESIPDPSCEDISNMDKVQQFFTDGGLFKVFLVKFKAAKHDYDILDIKEYTKPSRWPDWMLHMFGSN